MKKVIVSVIMIFAMVIGMLGCTNKTTEVAELPEIETAQETLDVCQSEGHAWMDATCEQAKSCSVCGATEGVALGHTWVEANYQQPQTCSVCAATQGQPLTPYFAESGLDAKLLDKNGTHYYTLTCAADAEKTTVGEVTVADYKCIQSDDTHEALDGYEWKVLMLKIHYSDENAQKYGFQPGGYLWADKYEPAIKEEDGEEKNEDGVIEDLYADGISQSFTWNGTEYNDGWLRMEESLTQWQQDENGAYYIDLYVTVSVRVPTGCDGFVFGLTPSDWIWPVGAYLHESVNDNILLFNLD